MHKQFKAQYQKKKANEQSDERLESNIHEICNIYTWTKPMGVNVFLQVYASINYLLMCTGKLNNCNTRFVLPANLCTKACSLL